MKKYLILVFAVFLVGCGNTKKAQPQTTEPSQSSKEIVHKEIDLKIYLPDYNVEDETFTIKGKATPETEITMTGGKEDTSTKASVTGSFELTSAIGSEDFEVVVSDGKSEEKATIQSLDAVIAEIKEREEEARKKLEDSTK